MMSYELNTAIRIELMYVKHYCNIVQFLIDFPTKLICLSTSIIEGGVLIILYLQIKHHFI